MVDKTVKLDDGKYEFDVSQFGCLVEARRHGEYWPAGMDFGFQGAFMSALYRIIELEASQKV